MRRLAVTYIGLRAFMRSHRLPSASTSVALANVALGSADAEVHIPPYTQLFGWHHVSTRQVVVSLGRCAMFDVCLSAYWTCICLPRLLQHGHGSDLRERQSNDGRRFVSSNYEGLVFGCLVILALNLVSHITQLIARSCLPIFRHAPQHR